MCLVVPNLKLTTPHLEEKKIGVELGKGKILQELRESEVFVIVVVECLTFLPAPNFVSVKSILHLRLNYCFLSCSAPPANQ